MLIRGARLKRMMQEAAAAHERLVRLLSGGSFSAAPPPWAAAPAAHEVTIACQHSVQISCTEAQCPGSLLQKLRGAGGSFGQSQHLPSERTANNRR
ncbi:unnamed protein product [Polarella glacialis]|uniref:Uncharacterized protein n=1 Tax=Polarella glacialis TaxID=89957 RepID=A0A813KRJ2_POLGL|nr:unnamed protein product [Polarella glacialis]